MFSQQMAQALL